MALSTKKYFTIILFLVSSITLSLYAQNSVEKPTVLTVSNCEITTSNNQNTDIADTTTISNLDNSNQFLVRLSNPKDSLAKATETNDQTIIMCDDNSSITASYSALAKDIIENYKYDFSETFIDILFFENIDLARKRTI
jgi:nitrogenase subunit NifH